MRKFALAVCLVAASSSFSQQPVPQQAAQQPAQQPAQQQPPKPQLPGSQIGVPKFVENSTQLPENGPASKLPSATNSVVQAVP